MTRRGSRRSPTGRARAELYARALGKRVVRILSVSESGGLCPAADADGLCPRPMQRGAAAKTEIDPGTQQLQVNVSMSFELQ